MAKKQNSIGFHKSRTPTEPQEFLRNHDQPEDKPERASRHPLAVPVFVDDVETTEILATYNLFPLEPIGKLEYQMIQVIASLEQELKKYHPDLFYKTWYPGTLHCLLCNTRSELFELK